MSTTSLRIVSLFFLAVCISLYIYTDRQQSYHDSRSKPRVEKILLDISSWEKEDLLKHLSKEAQQATSDEQLELLLQDYRHFGRLQRIEGLQFSRLVSALSLLDPGHINYQSNATFSQSLAHINVTLTASDGNFEIHNLTINAL